MGIAFASIWGLNMIRNNLLATAGVVALGLTAAPAFAAGTAANSNIVNTATVNYQVGSTPQTQITASNTLVVDRKVSMTVTEPGNAATSVSPGQTGAVTNFLVANTSNATLDFGLSAVDAANGTTLHGGTDNFNVSSFKIHVDTAQGGVFNGTYDPGIDVETAFVDELAADTSRAVFVVATIPAGRANGDDAVITLTTQAREGGTAAAQGAVVAQTTGANTAGMDTVFADTAGVTDAARDGQFSARDDYSVSAATLSVTKVSRVISDPINSTNPKMIPGAVVEYCIQVANAAGGADANTVVVSDAVPAQTTYDSTYGIFVGGNVNGTTGFCEAGTAGGSFASNTVTGTIASVPANSTRTLYFRVAIN